MTIRIIYYENNTGDITYSLYSARHNEDSSNERIKQLATYAANKIRKDPYRPNDWRIEYSHSEPAYGPELTSSGYTTPIPPTRIYYFNC